jgi:hypothetical protein
MTVNCGRPAGKPKLTTKKPIKTFRNHSFGTCRNPETDQMSSKLMHNNCTNPKTKEKVTTHSLSLSFTAKICKPEIPISTTSRDSLPKQDSYSYSFPSTAWQTVILLTIAPFKKLKIFIPLT